MGATAGGEGVTVRTVSTGSARLGNVCAAILNLDTSDPAALAHAATLLSRVVVDVQHVPGGPSLATWVEALEGASEERILVASPTGGEIPLEVVLALCAWPESDALVWGAGEGVGLALLRPERVLASAREALAKGSGDVAAWLEAIGAERVDRTALGLAELAREAC